MKEGRHGTLVSRSPYDRTDLDTQSAIETLLRRIFEKSGDSDVEIEKEWSVTKNSQDGYPGRIYAPRIDIAIGPFNIGPNWSDGLCRINQKYHLYDEIILGTIIQKGKLLSNEDIHPNKNPRCMVAIEIANGSEIKRMISDIFNASVLGKIGIFVYDQDQEVEEASHRALGYIEFLQQNKKLDERILKNMVSIKSNDILSVLEQNLNGYPIDLGYSYPTRSARR